MYHRYKKHNFQLSGIKKGEAARGNLALSHSVAPGGATECYFNFTIYQLPFCFNIDMYGIARDAIRVSAFSIPASSARM